MKRRLLGLALALGIVGGVIGSTPVPANAYHLNTVCRDHNGNDGPGGKQFEFCITLNEHDTMDEIQAMLRGDCYLAVRMHGESIEVHVDTLQLRRGSTAIPERMDNFVRVNNQCGLGYTDTLGTTNFYCYDGEPNRYADCAGAADRPDGWFWGYVRYYICWITEPGDPCSAWYTLSTPDVWRGDST